MTMTDATIAWNDTLITSPLLVAQRTALYRAPGTRVELDGVAYFVPDGPYAVTVLTDAACCSGLAPCVPCPEADADALLDRIGTWAAHVMDEYLRHTHTA